MNDLHTKPIWRAVWTAIVYVVFSVSAQTAFAGVSDKSPSGIQMVGPETALVWTENAQEFRMWRLQLGPEPQWTEIAEPEELSAFKHAQNPAAERDQFYVTVNVTDGFVRLLWLRHSDCEDKEWNKLKIAASIPCGFILYQAESELSSFLAHQGAAWHVTHSQLTDTPVQELLTVNQVKMADGQHGWMLLQGDSQMNRMPEKLVTTSDGGRHWIERNATGMPIGNDYPQLIFPRSFNEAWFLSSHPFGMWQTTDEGETWTRDAAISTDSRWCNGCSEGSAWVAPSSQGRSCFDLELDSIVSGAPTGQNIDRYCTTEDSRAWTEPKRLPVPGGGLREHTADPMVFADQRLGFSAVTVTPAYTSTVHETTDGGTSWHESALRAEGINVRVEQASAEGESVLLLMVNSRNGDKKLMYSADSGATWQKLELPHSDVAAHAAAQGTAADDHGLTLSLSLDSAPPSPPLRANSRPTNVNSCLDNYPSFACVPLNLTLENHGAQAIRTGLMTCGHRPIWLEHLEDDRTYREFFPDPQASNCLRTFMEWHTVPAGGSYALPVNIADYSSLENSGFRGDEPQTVQALWKVYGCPAARNLHPESDAPPTGVDRSSWRAQCESGTKPLENYVRLVSNPVTIEPPDKPKERERVKFEIPTKLKIYRIFGKVTIAPDRNSNESIWLTIDPTLVAATRTELRIYPSHAPRPAQSDATELNSGTDFASIGDFILNAGDRDFPPAGKQFTVEMDWTILETPIRPQHMWYPMIGTNYRVLRQRSIRQAIE
jgi:photosystem II stability/assembly factor-like uncharacterized protein